MIARELFVVPSYARDVEEGLRRFPKTLPAKLFYDRIGSDLFEKITELPEYYLTRAELEILQRDADAIVRAAGQSLTTVELGAGTAAKTCTLLRALVRGQMRVVYVPVDISHSALSVARERVETQCPTVRVQPLAADFSEGFGFLRQIPGQKMVLYLGSSIGNFDPAEAVAMLSKVREQLSPGDSLLLGTDLAKDPRVLVPAYDDAQGVTAAFNKNILRRLNDELGANFNLNCFRHIALWNRKESRMEMHLESLHDQKVRISLLQRDFQFRAGERIHTENSYKYTLPAVRSMLDQAGYKLERTWYDSNRWFALHLARV